MSNMTLPWFLQRFTYPDGRPLSGGKVYFYVGGSTNLPKNIFTDHLNTLPITQPLTLDASGVAPQYYCESGLYKVVVQDSTGAMVATRDYIAPAGEGTAVSDDHKVSVDSTDLATADYLETKVKEGPGVIVRKVVGATTYLSIEDRGYVRGNVSSTLGYLNDYFADSASIVWTKTASTLTASLAPSLASGIGKVKADTVDTQPDYLFNKFYNSATVSWVLDTNADTHGYHAIKANVDVSTLLNYKVKMGSQDPIPAYLYSKIRPGAGITITTASDGVSGDQIIINSRTNSWRPIKYVNSNYTVADTDDTIIVLGNFSAVTIPDPSVTYEGRLITIQAAGIGYSTTAYCAGGSIVGSTPAAANYSGIELLCVSNGSTYIWICRSMGQA